MNSTVKKVVPMKGKRTPIPTTRYDLADQVRNVHMVTAEDGTTKEELLNPAIWAHLANNFKEFDRIEVVHMGENSYFCELIVVAVYQGGIKVEELRYHELDKQQGSGLSVNGFTIKWGNKHTGFRVIRDSDRETVKENLPSREDAMKWIEENKYKLTV